MEAEARRDLMTPEEIERARIELERERLALEAERAELRRLHAGRRESLFERHFGAIATGVVSLAIAVFSVVQFLASEAADEREALRAAAQREQELEMQQLQQDRDWRLTIVSFVTEHRNEIFSPDEAQRARMQRLMLVAFPPDITSTFFEQAAQTAPEEQRLEWRRQQVAAREMIPATVYLHIGREEQREAAQRMKARLEQEGFVVPGIEHVDVQRASSVVRFFRTDAQEEAAAISDALRPTECSVPPEDASGWRGAHQARPRTFEIWLGSDCP